ncbi:hypothetical protein COY87_04355 [Candidatus Roizmanbacteria bacterium CG_4_10_14_0_8_um_filter_33_9]|uniref:Uncharacterized protein n=1 Tax=Candidatus Roizmanbacteria bacterium CG_4_10_14_0_8_um_filter_33_9 TaxID=1974826 RepID=A0A2M7QHI0_9BACT|nr:MAG: hypothetical protein COY87_04355 [Candidatus Roizmanbacteria bacterium CG_4_10_14_0_8_um_filter_33_9]
MRKIKNGIILAGGNSDRLWPLKDKIFTMYLGKSFISYLTEQLSQYCERIFIVVNDLNKTQIQDVTKNLHTYIVQNKQYSGMAGAVMSCSGKLEGEALILNASDYFNFEIISKIIEKSQDRSIDVILIAKKVNSYFPGGYLTIDGNTVISIVEKPLPQETPSDLVNLVIDYYKDFDQFLSYIIKTETHRDDWFENGLNLMLTKRRVEWIQYSDYWYALKYPWNILQLMKFFLFQIKESANDLTSVTIDPSATVSSKVVLGKNVKIGHYSKISGPCYIGDNTVIGDYSLIRESHIGSNCLIGSSSEVARSYIGNKVSLHRNYIGDSVLSDNVLMGAGAVTANFRFDEKDIFSSVSGKKVNSTMRKFGSIIGKRTKIGVNSVIFPGIKIGTNSLIGPGEKVTSDIPDNGLFFEGSLKKV